MKTDRKSILDAALKCVNGERDAQYGSPERNFETIANLWNSYLGSDRLKASIRPHDVAAMLALLKIARIGSGQAKEDNWIDLAGYAACGGEVQMQTPSVDAADNVVGSKLTGDAEAIVDAFMGDIGKQICHNFTNNN